MFFNQRMCFLSFLFFFVLNLAAQNKQAVVPLKEALIEIEQQHQISFNYIEEVVEGIQLIPPDKSLSLEQKLKYLKNKTKLSYENIKNKYINIYNKSSINSDMICGYVFSATDREPLENANIHFDNGKQITTDSKGYFEFKKEIEDNFTVIYMGFIPQKILTTTLENKKCLKIILEPKVTELPEIKTNRILATGISKKLDGSLEIKPKKFDILPGLIEADALQTMLQIPGVNSIDESASNINVRGGTHDQNLFLWNGIRIYQTGHFFGLISVFNPNLAQTIKIYKNGSSAFYGENVSSVVTISSTPEKYEENNFGAGINMINADVYAKYNLSKKSFIEVSGRKSISDLLVTPTYDSYFNKIFQNTTITDFSENQKINYEIDKNFSFYDATFKYFQKIGTKNLLVMDFITINDKLTVYQSDTSNDITSSEKDILRQQNYGGNLFWKRNWNNHNSTKINMYTSTYLLLADKYRNIEDQSLTQDNIIQDYAFSVENNHIINSKICFNNGYQFNEIGATNLDQVSNPDYYSKTKDVLRTHALIFEGKYNDTVSKLYCSAGMRINYIENFKKYIVEPRTQFKYRCNSNLNLELLGELKSQNCLQIIELQDDYFGIEKRRWIVADNSTYPIQISKQVSFNLLYKKNNWLIDVENFYKIVDGISSSSQGFQNQLEFSKLTGGYKVIGTELLIQKSIHHFLTWLSYTYNDNNYHFSDYGYPDFPNNFEIKHNISWAGIYEKNNFNIALGAKWSSGKPITTPISYEIDPDDMVIQYNKPNNSKLPSFFQINLSSTYKWETQNRIQYKLGISILNILNKSNEINKYYRLGKLTNSIQEVATYSIQRTPNLSFRVVF